jgi:hypothetical protein
MANLHRFIRSVSPYDLRNHLAQSGIPLPENLNWDAAGEEFTQGFLKAVEQLTEQELVQLLADIDRVSDMTDEVGQAALMALADWRDRLRNIDGAHRRAHWLYVQSRDAFRQAEEIRYADENQNAQRMWDGFVGPRLADMKADEITIDSFRSKLPEALGVERVHIEYFGRIRSREGEPDREIKQVTIYSEDVPVDELVFAATGVENRARKPVRETAVIYEPSSGTIEVVGRIKTIRETVAKLFAEMLLGVELTGERLPRRRVDLTPLLYSDNLPVEQQDGIALVKLTMLALSTLDGKLIQRFEVPFKEALALHTALANQYGPRNPLRSQLRPWMARIEIELEPQAGRKRGKKINVNLCAPNKCSLRGKTAKERLVLNRYLRAWGLLRGVDE